MSEAYHASVNVICFESCVLYRSGVILCCVRGGFPWRFMGGGEGGFAKWIVSFLIGLLVFRSGQKGQLRFAGVG